jgi:hypothetical protein
MRSQFEYKSIKNIRMSNINCNSFDTLISTESATYLVKQDCIQNYIAL